jgi:hypothetical protein
MPTDSIEVAVRTRLLATAGVTAMVSQRIYPDARAQGGAVPCLITGIQSEQKVMAFVLTGLTTCRFEVTAVARTRAETQSLAAAVMLGLNGWTGTDGSIVIQQCLHSNTMTAYQDPMAGESSGTFVSVLVFSIHYAG